MPKQTFFNLPIEKQERIIDCAADEFAEHGYRTASVSRIVAAAGIAKGSFYQYFEDKEDLYGYVVERAIVQRKMRVSGEEITKLEDLNLTQFIRVLFLTMMREFIERPKLLKISMDFLNHQSEPVQKRIYEKYEHIKDDYFQRFIRFEKSRGEIDPNVDEDVLSNMMVGVSYQIADYAKRHGYESLTEAYIDGIVDRIEYILTNGIYKGV